MTSENQQKIRVLIVEDEETSLHIITLALQRHNRELIFARDGEAAVRLATSERPAVIVMDMMLPKLDGFEATRRIKSDPALAAIPVIALTARTGDFDERKAREAGCADYITKPYRIEHLRARLAPYLG
jgi:two-component system, cell cycle response regulator DivK